MTKRRMVHDCLWQSEAVASLDYRQRLLWIGLITTADDQGRGRAHPGLIRAAVFPFDVIAQEDITADLQAIAARDMVLVYEVEGKLYYQVVHWWDYQSPQWVGPSDFPAPDGWEDRLRYHGKGHQVVTQNWPHTPDKAANDKGDLSPDKPAFEREKEEEEEEVKEREILSSASADYQAIRMLWLELFPDKPKPRASNKVLIGKAKTRMGDSAFSEQWEAALQRAARSKFCRTEGWFDLPWFLENDNNWEKCLNGKYDDKGVAVPEARAKPRIERRRIKDPATGEWIEKEVIA